MVESEQAKQLAAYTPMWMGLARSVRDKGETDTLKMVVQSDLKRHLRDYYRDRLIFEVKLLDTLRGMTLDVLKERLNARLVMLNCWFCFRLAEVNRHGLPDLGKEVPAFLLNFLVREPQPFLAFVQILAITESCRVHFEELERRTEAHPVLEAVVEYAELQEPLRAATGFLKMLTFRERATKARFYSSEVRSCKNGRFAAEYLDQFVSLEESLGQAGISLGEAELERLVSQGVSRNVALRQSDPIRSACHNLHRQFPDLELEIADLIAKSTDLSAKERRHLANGIRQGCSLLVKCEAIWAFGYGATLRADKNTLNDATARLFAWIEGLDEESISRMSPVELRDFVMDQTRRNTVKPAVAKGFKDMSPSDAREAAYPGVVEGAEGWGKTDVWEIIQKGLSGHLQNSLRQTVERDLVDKTREGKHKEDAVSVLREMREFADPNDAEEWIDEQKREIDDGAKRSPAGWRRREVSAAGMNEGQSVEEEDDQTEDDLLSHIALKREPWRSPLGKLEEVENDQWMEWARRELPRLKKKAKLTKQREIIIDLTAEGKGDREIALALQKCLGKTFTEGNVRKSRFEAMAKLKEAASEIVD